jgi:hypothetical protein
MTTILIVSHAEQPEEQIQGVNARGANVPVADFVRLAAGVC